jgi:hypothetical protein
LPAGRIAALGATPDLHHGLLDHLRDVERRSRPSDAEGVESVVTGRQRVRELFGEMFEDRSP